MHAAAGKGRKAGKKRGKEGRTEKGRGGERGSKE